MRPSIGIVLLSIAISTTANFDWCEENGVIKYGYFNNCTKDYWSVNNSVVYFSDEALNFNFKNGCCQSNTKTFENLNDSNTKEKGLYFIEEGVQLKTLYIRVKDPNTRIRIGENHRPEGLFVYFGCRNECRKNVDDGHRTAPVVQKKGLILFSEIDEKFYILITRIDTTNIPYLYISGNVKQTINILFERPINPGGKYSKMRYLFTGPETNTVTFYNSFTIGEAKSVCERNNIHRYLLFLPTETNSGNFQNTNCTCVPNSNELLNEYSWNYPDCRYNHSLFDLDIQKFKNYENEIIVELYEWYRLLQSESVKYTFKPKNEDQYFYMKFEILKIEEDYEVTFEMPVNITTLEIYSFGKYYFKNGLEVQQVTLNQDFKNTILFAVNGMFIEKKTSLLTQCGKRVFKKGSDDYMCYCNYTNGAFYYNRDGYYITDDCLYPKELDLTLQINSSEYAIEGNQYWNKINLLVNEVTILVNNGLTEQFLIETNNISIQTILNIQTNLKVNEVIEVGENAHISVSNNAILKFDENSTISFQTIRESKNINGIITVEGNSTIDFPNPINNERPLLSFEQNFSSCFEFISFEKEQQTLLFKNTKNEQLLGGKLLRICPNDIEFDYNVLCILIKDNMTDFMSYERNVLHCPLSNENATILIKTEIFRQSEDFNGVFTQENNVLSYTQQSIFKAKFYQNEQKVVYITNDSQDGGSLLFTQNTSKLLLGDEIGFAEVVTPNSLKSKSYDTVVEIEISVENGCRVFNVSSDIESKCLICKKDYYYYSSNSSCEKIDDKCSTYYDNSTISFCQKCPTGFEPNKGTCLECPQNCLRCVEHKCVSCETDYYYNESGECFPITYNNNTMLIYHQNVLKCSEGFYVSNGHCELCPENCVSCRVKQSVLLCEICNTKSLLKENDTATFCELQKNANLTTTSSTIICEKMYFLNFSNTCEKCSEYYGVFCEICDTTQCIKCSSNGVLNNSGICVEKSPSYCTSTSNTYCEACVNQNMFLNSSGLCELNENCSISFKNEKCTICEKGYLHTNDNSCITAPDNSSCGIFTPENDRCIRCEHGYYVSDDKCMTCTENCTECYNSTLCLKCSENFYLYDDGSCIANSNVTNNCKKLISGSSKCAICDTSYFRNFEGKCQSCIENCLMCNNEQKCLSCQKDYFLLIDSTQCISYDKLVNCDVKDQSGCSKCTEGFYIDNQYCSSCSSQTTNCSRCNQNGMCSNCDDNFVLISQKCVPLHQVANCVEVTNSKCTSCSFWHIPSASYTSCKTKVVWWVILLCVLFMVFIGVLLITIGIFSMFKILEHRRREALRRKICLFDIKNSNVQFVKTSSNGVLVNMKEITFENPDSTNPNREIKVGQESRQLLCVGNSTKNTLKIQFSSKASDFKYSFRTEPKIVSIPKGKACEFEVYLTPNCSTEIHDKVLLLSSNLKTGNTSEFQMSILAKTEISTKLDPDELVEEKKLGEGSFGVVYKGEFRGNVVAIKKMKEITNNEKSIEEFKKEVAMLEKFRCGYIVHFYGAVFIPSKICLVTEFANYGSLKDLMTKTQTSEHILHVTGDMQNASKTQPISINLRVKFCLDAAKGILYLHENGILHRDIKPDNFLVFSLDLNDTINAKLTDFGSSRNVNQMISNMTFTKGIGTPVYMAPEVLNKEKYTESADIFSFAISLYETVTWKEAFPKEKFKFPWTVANFITGGKRFERTEDIPIQIYEVMDMCWKQNKRERMGIKETVKKLEKRKKFKIFADKGAEKNRCWKKSDVSKIIVI
ncbi:protein serine/threonine kinase, putative [Entamoeba invadens IP1]|uniref:Protein serine/threonine kinase, putative n=1 Tax=Entamoeba invadens IP1 TaxID=370355 RepID=A0A0A1U3D9_ENTIV|nr:protein serine/threonine kinase, putative [Entamoeba invadens IP1]ELP86126.1 protein serine/threonine kinase, putative [Entamoeba invadens IP1]|eukprot:XP_004185472.1 protein serine/threonine kinase, putative [Entamoeba invadens IP1]